MKRKLFSLLVLLLTAVSGAWAEKDIVPSDAVLSDYYNQGDVCVCIYVPADINCNDIVLTGSFNGWSTNVASLPHFESIEGYDGWYIASFEPEDEPDPEKGMQAKPVMLQNDGSFTWDYEIGAATAIRGGVQVEQGASAGQINLINYGADAPNILTVDAWKMNPCTAIYHNYKFTVVSDGCDGFAVPFLAGSMTNWEFRQMQLDAEKTQEYQVPTYFINIKAAEGTPYQIVSGLMNEGGEITVQPAWTNDAYIQKQVNNEWVRLPGEDGENQLTHEDPNIVWDLRAEDLRWARSASAPTGDGYTLTVGENEHGTVKFLVGQNEVTTAAEGETVTVVITPDEGWAVNKPAGKWYAAGSATKAPHRAQNGIDLQQSFELTKLLGQDNTYSFVMDRANAEVSVSYKKLLTHQDITTLDIAAVTYTSEALEPAVTVKDGQTVLVKDTDYTVAYSNNINAAKADATENAPTVTITAVSTSEKFAGEITKTFTINPDTLKEVSLEDTLFMYNFVEPVEQTAVVKEVKSKTLTVPATMYEVVDNSNKGTEPGQYTVTVSGKGNFTGTASTTFTIKNQEVNGTAEETETGEEVDDVTVTVSVVDRDEQTLNIDNISEGTTSGEGITVEIPAKINGWKVTSISNGAMDGMGNVTDIIMPDTDEPIKVEAGAFPGIATIHTSLALLDDYALMAGLQPNYEATKVVCTVTPVNKYWTLGTGCDVIIPDGIDVYTVQEKNTAEVATEIVPEDQLQYGKERIIKANNGVLLLGTAGQSYDLVAFSGRLASGMPVATTDNKNYGKKNCLEPVVEKKHYDSGHYFVLQNNEFHSILAEGDEVKVPAGKAVLHLGDEQAGATARVLLIDAETTKIGRTDFTDDTEKAGAWYAIDGRRVAQPTNKGVYIMNGKKVVIK